LNKGNNFNDITFISLIKDNEPDTLLLLNYLSKLNIKISHIVADGSKKKQKYLFDKYRNLEFKYFYFGEDKSYIDLYKKIYFSLKKVKTSYVYFLDQGDYLNFDALKIFYEILKKNKEYSCALGEVYNFKVIKKKIIINSGNLYNYNFYKSKFAQKRIIKNFISRTYHSLHKTKILKNSLNIICKLSLNEPRSAELIIDFNNLLNGNVFKSDDIMLIHNASNNSNEKTSLNAKYKTRKIWFERFFKYKFNEILNILSKINRLNFTKNQIANIYDHFEKSDIKFNEAQNKFTLLRNIVQKISITYSRNTNLKKFVKFLDGFKRVKGNNHIE